MTLVPFSSRFKSLGHPATPRAWPTFVLCAAATLWLWPGLTFTLGLHGDEAYVGLSALKLLARPTLSTLGMNTHTGPLHQWLVAAAFFFFGPSITVLRAVGAVANGLCIAWIYRALQRVVGQRLAVGAALLMLTLPAVSTFGAVATEHMALSPLCAVLAWSLLVPNSRRPPRLLRAFFGGAVLGLGTWTHLIFVAAPAAFVVLGARQMGRTFVRSPSVRAALLGFGLVELGPLLRLSSRIKVAHGGAGILLRLLHLPELMWKTWRGSYAALRTVGTAPGALDIAAITVWGLALWGLWQLHRRQHSLWPVASASLWAAGAMLGVTAVIAPFDSDRFVVLPLYLVPLVMVLGFEGAACGLNLPGRAKALLQLCLFAAALAVQTHFFVAHIAGPINKHQGVGNSFSVFGMVETNNHYSNTTPLYEALLTLQHPEVVCQNFIGWALRFEQACRDSRSPRVQQKRLRVHLYDDNEHFEPRAQLTAGRQIVQYKKGLRHGLVQEPPVDAVILKLDHFIVSSAQKVVSHP